jgi:chromosome segregation ATPase
MIEFIALLVTIVSSSASLGYWLARKFNSLEMRVGGLETKVGSLEMRIGGLETKVGGLEMRVGGLETKVGSLEMRIGRIEEEISSLKGEVGSLKVDFSELKNAVRRLGESMDVLKSGISGFNEILLQVLKEKDIVTEVEHRLLVGALRAYIPLPTSKYYTEEVRKKLIEILNKNPDDYTMDDVYELRNIADLMIKEYHESGEKRKDLLDYAGQLYMASLMIKVLFVKPKILKAGIKAPEFH